MHQKALTWLLYLYCFHFMHSPGTSLVFTFLHKQIITVLVLLVLISCHPVILLSERILVHQLDMMYVIYIY